MHISEGSLDDLLRRVLTKLLSPRCPSVSATRGSAKELIGVMLELKNPRARLSRTESRGKIFSALGELLWYLSRSNKVEFIAYYAAKYRDETEDGKTIHGAYGPRFFSKQATDSTLKINQIKNVLDILRSRPTTRRAVIQLFDASDLTRDFKEVPCTCTMQFFIRKERLHLLVNMRSNDAYLGLPHDIFAFTLLQEIFARSLGVELGSYKHVAGSMHLYSDHMVGASKFLSEDWQENVPMPAMPQGDPWPSLRKLIAAERAIRTGKKSSTMDNSIAPYWQDFIRLLQIYNLSSSGHTTAAQTIKGLKRNMSSKIYDPYIQKRHRIAKRKPDQEPKQTKLFEPTQTG